jgi:TPR repeat protein
MTMETTAHRPSKESKAFDSDRATSHPPTASFIRARAARADLSQDDPIPLFLSDPLGAPDPGEYAPIEVRSRIVPRVLAAVLTASTLAILVTLYQSDFRGLFPANAVSWMGIAPEQAMASANTPAMTQSSLKDSDRATNTRLASADTQVPPAPSTPSREAIATAYQTALQAQAPAPAPVAAPPAPPPPAKTLDADAARDWYQRAAALGSSEAEQRLALLSN